MNAAALCTTLQQAVPPLFVCSPAPQQGVRVRTPMLYPEGNIVEVYVMERKGGFLVTDIGDALDWLGLQTVSQRRSPKQEALILDVCHTLPIDRFRDQLLLREVTSGALGESVFWVAQAAVRVVDLWFTLRSQAVQTVADEVDEWLSDHEIPFERQVSRQGRSVAGRPGNPAEGLHVGPYMV